MKLFQHALNVIDELTKQMSADGRIPTIPSTEMLRLLRQKPNAGVNLGKAIALLDAASATVDLPWLGRLVVFEGAADDFVGKWSDWAPYKKYITELGPRQKHWSNVEMDRVRAAVLELPQDPNTWWDKEQENSAAWLQRALLVLLHQAYDTTSAV